MFLRGRCSTLWGHQCCYWLQHGCSGLTRLHIKAAYDDHCQLELDGCATRHAPVRRNFGAPSVGRFPRERRPSLLGAQISFEGAGEGDIIVRNKPGRVDGIKHSLKEPLRMPSCWRPLRVSSCLQQATPSVVACKLQHSSSRKMLLGKKWTQIGFHLPSVSWRMPWGLGRMNHLLSSFLMVLANKRKVLFFSARSSWTPCREVKQL